MTEGGFPATACKEEAEVIEDRQIQRPYLGT